MAAHGQGVGMNAWGRMCVFGEDLHVLFEVLVMLSLSVHAHHPLTGLCPGLVHLGHVGVYVIMCDPSLICPHDKHKCVAMAWTFPPGPLQGICVRLSPAG